jgi:hypothetical protein
LVGSDVSEGYTLAQLRAKVRDVLRDDAASDSDRFVQNSEIDGWLNEAALDIAWRTRTFRREETSTWSAATKLPTLPTDFVSVLQLRLGTDDVEFVDDQLFWDWKDSTGTPAHPLGRVFGQTMEVYPSPVAGTAYALRYVARPAVLDSDADQPDIPQTWQLKMVRYAQAMAQTALHEFADADRYMALYEAGLPARPNNEKNMPGPLQLSPAMGPFDEDLDARHMG